MICFFVMFAVILFLGNANVLASDNNQMNLTAIGPTLDEVNEEALLNEYPPQPGPQRDDAVGGKWLFIRDNEPWTSMDWMFDQAGVDYDIMTDPNQLANVDLTQYNVIWVREYQTNQFNTDYNNNRSFVDDWVADGGCLYSCDAYNGVGKIHPGGLVGIQRVYDIETYTAATQEECLLFDLLNWNLNTPNRLYQYYTYYPAASITEASNGNWQQMVTTDPNGAGYNLVATYGFGEGNVVVSGYPDGIAFYYRYSGWGRTYHNIFHYLLSLSDFQQEVPEISVYPVALNFGDIEFRRSAELTFDIGNDGNFDLTVSNISVDGDDFTVVVEENYVIEPEETVTIMVTYTANTIGDVAGEITIVSDDPDNPEVTVALGGTSVWVSPLDLLPRLCDYINDLKDARILNKGQANSLCVKAQNAANRLERGQVHTALNILNALLNQVNCFIAEEVLPEENGQWLIFEANFIIDLLTEYGIDGLDGQNLSSAAMPSMINLAAAYPNPFNSTTTISFSLPDAGHVNLAVFDIAGRQVATLVEGHLAAGFHKSVLVGNNLQSGLYLVRMIAQGETHTVKVMFVK